MKIAKPVNIFALAEAHPQSAPAAPATPADPVPLKTVFGDGRQTDMSSLLANFSKQHLVTSPMIRAALAGNLGKPLYPGGPLVPPVPFYWTPVIGAPQPKTGGLKPVEFAPTLPSPAKAGGAAESPTIKTRSKDAFSWWSGSHTVVAIPQNASQDQLAHLLKEILPARQADSVANAVLQFIHSQGGHAVIVAITTGGLVAAILAFFGYNKHLIGVSVAAAVVACGVVFFFGHQENPLVGKWNLNAIESHYQPGTPPREAVDDITEEGGGLKISRLAIEEDGKREGVTYHIDPDGKGRPTSEHGADSMTAKLVGNTLTTTYSKNGVIVATESRSLSADQKRMTVLSSGHTAAGEAYKDVAVYDRK